jgi:uncharacterized repeat protein (TIGR03803 family)
MSGNLIFDSAGNMYGTTWGGGNSLEGTVYELSPSHGAWVQTVLHSFSGVADGEFPRAGLVIDSVGNLYGTAPDGGTGSNCSGGGCGVVYELTPSGSGWTEAILHTFQGTDGAGPVAGLVKGPSGELYGATGAGGTHGNGVIFELIPSGGNWTYSVLYNFQGPASANGPYGNLALDRAGVLYGATYSGGAFGAGSVFKLAPVSGGWVYTPLHDFTGAADGALPIGAVALDANGNLYGTAATGGTNSCYNGISCGVIWEITP